MYVCVYAICKNEEKFAERWAKSMSEADGIYVLDTGSSDKTAEILRKHKVNVTVEEIKPWRFDTARNRSLSLVPVNADICVCTDLDEVFEKGWRKKVEDAWINGVNRLNYRYTWSFNPDGSEGTVFFSDKIHSRHEYKWVNPVHEVLSYIGSKKSVMRLAKGVQLNHYPDETKPRGQYLKLLELAVEEDPKNDRNMHYLGREYMFHGDWDKAIITFKRHLSMENAVWEEERCASMRYTAFCYENKGEISEAKRWYHKAVGEMPYTREPWVDFGKFCYRQKDWYGVIYLIKNALLITERRLNYITDADAWGSLPHDLLSLGYYYTKDYEKALESAKTAASLSPSDMRIKENIKLISEMIK